MIELKMPDDPTQIEQHLHLLHPLESTPRTHSLTTSNAMRIRRFSSNSRFGLCRSRYRLPLHTPITATELHELIEDNKCCKIPLETNHADFGVLIQPVRILSTNTTTNPLKKPSLDFMKRLGTCSPQKRGVRDVQQEITLGRIQ
jgi:hypothetical protein